jgi:hypothetical protein
MWRFAVAGLIGFGGVTSVYLEFSKDTSQWDRLMVLIRYRQRLPLADCRPQLRNTVLLTLIYYFLSWTFTPSTPSLSDNP